MSTYGKTPLAGGASEDEVFAAYQAATTEQKFTSPVNGVSRTRSSGKADFNPVHHMLALNESANVSRFVRLFADRFMFVPGVGWFEWDGTHWAKDELGEAFNNTEAVATVLDKELDEYLTSPDAKALPAEDVEKLEKSVKAWRTKTLGIRARQAVLTAAESKMAVHPTDLNRDQWSLVVENGTLDLRTRTLRDSVPGDRNTQRANVAYEADARCPKFDALLHHAMQGDEELISYMWRVLGYTLTGSVAEQSFFFLWGVRGSGKSTICEIMLELLGDYGLKMDENSLFGRDQHPTWISDLLGKRLLFKDELNQDRKINTALVNTLVSGGKMRGRKMGSNFTDIPVQGKLFMATNHRPPMGSAADGVWRRIKPVHFGKAVPEPEKVLDYAAKLVAEEGPGILLKCLEGLWDYTHGGLRPPAAVTQDAASYQDSEDELSPFVLDHLESSGDEADWISNQDLYALYAGWCEAGGIKPMSQTGLSRHLVELGFKPSGTCYAVHKGTKAKKYHRGWTGMRVLVEDSTVQMWKRVGS